MFNVCALAVDLNLSIRRHAPRCVQVWLEVPTGPVIRRLNLKRRVGPGLRQGRRKARSLGLAYHVATPTQLLLDLDTPAQWSQYQWMFPYLTRYLHCTVTKVTDSRSNAGGKHVYIELAHPLTGAERIALQSILGSDPMREWLGLLRDWGGARDPIQLFEKPETDAD